jgi:hypothetical protein
MTRRIEFTVSPDVAVSLSKAFDERKSVTFRNAEGEEWTGTIISITYHRNGNTTVEMEERA